MKKSFGAKTLVFPTPTWIVGTYDKDGRPNVMAAAWGGICCSDPPCIAVSLRKATYTYRALMSRKAFTVNVPSESQVKEADYFGLVSGRCSIRIALCKPSAASKWSATWTPARMLRRYGAETEDSSQIAKKTAAGAEGLVRAGRRRRMCLGAGRRRAGAGQYPDQPIER